MNGFNANRERTIDPGCHITVDESMSSWRGADSTYVAEGEPHVTKIIRKPEGVGAELKTAADGDSGIMIRLDVMEGKDVQQRKPFYNTFKSEGTAVVLRLVEPWFNSGRVIHADSAFSSVKTLQALQKFGMFFMGIVKTAHTQFPLKFLQEKAKTVDVDARGSHVLMSSNHMVGGAPEERTMYALGWFDAVPKFIISNYGVTTPGSLAIRPRQKKVEKDGFYVTEYDTIKIPRPGMVETFFQFFSVIDGHNRLRQGEIEMERNWHTQKYQLRIFATLFSMCVVDSHLGYAYEGKDCSDKVQYGILDFCKRLSSQLMFYDPGQSPVGTRHPTRSSIPLAPVSFLLLKPP